jgi:hypothetical protein
VTTSPVPHWLLQLGLDPLVSRVHVLRVI